jgi:hypothetical protein
VKREEIECGDDVACLKDIIEELNSVRYTFVDITPLVISNNDIVQVYFKSTEPNPTDFIGAYSPSDADPKTMAPVLYGSCVTDPEYLSTGSGMLNFQFTNLRQDGTDRDQKPSDSLEYTKV